MTTVSTDRHAPFLSVSASAGSGKTYLLIERLLRLLLTGALPGSVLAITFTRKAAGEIHWRLQQRLQELALTEPSRLTQRLQELQLDNDQRTCNRARALYETLLHDSNRIRTMTFHAFCQDLLRRFPLEAEVPPGFEVLERSGHILDAAWAAFALELTQNPQTPLAQAMDNLLIKLNSHALRQTLFDFLAHRNDWWAMTDGQSDPVGFALTQLTKQWHDDPALDPIEMFCHDPATRQALGEFTQLLQRHPTTTNLKHAETIQHFLGHANAAQPVAFESLTRAFLTDKEDPYKKDRQITATLKKKLGDADAERFVTLNDSLCESIIAVKRTQHGRQTLAVTRDWLRCGERLLAHYQRIKHEQRVLDFNDLEWKTYRLLTHGDNAQWVQYKLDERVQHILIDEFQDTNPTQWQLLLPLLEEIAAHDHAAAERSVLLVGDAKQSIYRFRRAEPRLFDQASAWLGEHLAAATLPLTHSYRSSRAIIDFVNRLYQREPRLLTEFTAHTTAREELWGKVTLLPPLAELADPPPPDPTPRRLLVTPPRSTSASEHYREGQRIASIITELISNQTSIQDGKQIRAAHYGDIMILFRSRTHVSEYERALREKQIPYLGTERGTLLDSLEIQDMMNLLKWLTTPYDNLALAGILRSPLFAADDDDLQRLATKQGDWYQRLLQLTDLAHGSALQRAAQWLPNWLTLTATRPVHDLLDHIYSDGDVLARYRSAFPPHLQHRVQANLTRFIELALEIDSGRYPSLTRFLHWLGRLKQTSEAPDQPSSGVHEHRVQLLTVHAAKGLEAPIVFVADCANAPQPRAAARVLLDWPDNAPAPHCMLLDQKGKHTVSAQARLRELAEQKDRREEINLGYVAVTRAKQYLYLSVAALAKSKSSAPPSALYWYGEICQRFDLDPDALSDAVTLSQFGDAPRCTASAPAPPIDSTLDARLQQPIQVAPLWREIAPSHQVSHYDPYHAPDPDAQWRGVLTHQILQELAQQPALSYTTFCHRLGISLDPHLLQSCWAEAQQVLQHPDTRFLFDTTRYEQAYVEIPVYYAEQNAIVHGVVDRLVRYPDTVHVIDYKTHRYRDPDELQVIAARYQQQLHYYSEAARRLWPKHAIRAWIVFTQGPALYAM